MARTAHLRMTSRRLHLLEHVGRIQHRECHPTLDGRRVTGELARLVAAGLVESTGGPTPWRPTALGRGHLAIRVMDWGSRVTAETGAADDVTVVAEMRPFDFGNGPYGRGWQIFGAIGVAEPFLIPARASREHARQVLRHIAAQAIAAGLTEVAR